MACFPAIAEGLLVPLLVFFLKVFSLDLLLSLFTLEKMVGNGVQLSGLAPGHFLFTSESVGEGHPGLSPFFALLAMSSNPIFHLKIRSVIKFPMLLLVDRFAFAILPC